MANCGETCNCIVRAGDGVIITGSGSALNPYIVSLSGDLSELLQVEDSQTVNLTLLGSGTAVDPYVLSAAATVRLTQLADVSDPQGGPNAGDVPTWVTTGTPHWEFQPAPPNPAGAVNVSTGIIGDGTAGAPIRVRLIGTSAGGTTSGLEVYADSAGNLRTVPPVASAVSWDSITGKPSTFPTNDASFSGTLSVGKGGTGATSLASITVGNSTKVANHNVFVQSSTPSGAVLDDLWFY